MEAAAAYRQAGLPIAALEALDAERLEASDDPAALVLTWDATAEAWHFLRRHEQSLAALQRAVAIEAATELATALRQRIHAHLAVAHAHLGRFGPALDAARAALETSVPEGNDDLRPRLNLTLSGVHIARGEWLPAEAAAQRALHVFEEQDNEPGIAQSLNNLGRVAASTERLLAARHLLERAGRISEAAALAREVAQTHSELAWVYLRLNDHATALRHGGLALAALWERVGYVDKSDLARLSHLFGGLYRAAGDHVQAIACLNRAAAYYAQGGRQADWRSVAAELDGLLAASERPPATGSRGFPIPAADRARAHHLMTLLSLGESLASIHPQLEGHAEVVTAYALALGRCLGLTDGEIEVLGHAGRLMDIGLTLGEVDDARAERLHPEAGAELLRSFPLPEACLVAIRQHQERWDGSGYPAGLSGADIALPARILAVADAYVKCALGPGTPDHSGGMAELRAEAGRAFDPELVSAFEALHDGALRRPVQPARWPWR